MAAVGIQNSAVMERSAAWDAVFKEVEHLELVGSQIQLVTVALLAPHSFDFPWLE